jgi:hypothetical protein
MISSLLLSLLSLIVRFIDGALWLKPETAAKIEQLANVYKGYKA